MPKKRAVESFWLFYRMETRFLFLIHCWPIRARAFDMQWHKNNQKIEKCNCYNFTGDFLIIVFT